MNTCGPSQLAAQTLFLGASVADFNVNMAWGGRPSQLSVKLVEDISPCSIKPFVDSSYEDDHYHTCAGDSCYIDENGNPYNSDTSKERVIPGKVYYEWTPNSGFVSKYWYDQDPGFFGAKNCFTNTGSYSRANYDTSNGFDIINAPVLFRVGNFSFAGLVQNWEQNYDSGGLNYNLTIESMDAVLDQCYIILDKYAGAIFGKSSGNLGIGGPLALIDASIQYYGKIIDGNIPNVFNVYGFLESLGANNFGGSNRNDNGISATAIIDALSILTSSIGPQSVGGGLDLPSDKPSRRAFSPFGRIITKVPQENQTYLRITPAFAKMGFLPVTYDINGTERCHFALDLSELPRPPLDFRINEPVLSITSFIQQITTATGSDFYFDTIPATIQGSPYNIIKVKVITRSAQPDPRQIEKTIVNFQNNGYAISSSRIGKEKNTNTSRVMYIGPQQQRLYQAKSYRLAFSQTNYIYSPTLDKFVDFYDKVAGLPDAGEFGKYRLPSALSTRNPTLVSQVAGAYSDLFNLNENLKTNIVGGQNFYSVDNQWLDPKLSTNTRVGNYGITQQISKSLTQAVSASPRFFPLYKDVICPFFGFKNEENFSINTNSGENNVLKVIRPVWMDNWTGQIVVLMDITELPTNMNVQLKSPYNNSTMFTISESEIRAASKGFDEYLTYCHGKMFSPDLYKMIRKAYVDAKKIIFETEGAPHKGQGNAAGSMGQPTLAKPSPNALEIDYNLVFNQDFLRDFTKLYNLVNQLSQYYGSKYLVKMPEVLAYRDQQYSDVQIPDSILSTSSAGSTTSVQVYKGSGKIFYNYEIATDGAWEEYGNVIDDNIVVGSSDWYSLTDDNGRIQPILGYISNENIDYLAKAICNSNTLDLSNYGYDQYEMLEMRQSILELIASSDSTCESLTYASIDISQLSNDNFIVKNSAVVHNDPFGNAVIGSKKVYQKANVDKDMVFLDPVNLRNPYAVVNATPIPLNGTSKFYTQDPNRTVMATASAEDLSICARINAVLRNKYVVNDGDTTDGETGDSTTAAASQPFTSLEESDIKIVIKTLPITRILLHRLTSILGNNQFLDLDAVNTSVNNHLLSPKVAHPYFAAIPVKSNQYCYGPWINYPHLDKNIIFPDAIGSDAIDNAIENLVGGVEVKYESGFAPWEYGGMSNLDQAVVYDIYNEIQYQQIIETATLSIPGLPIFGLGSSFVYNAEELTGDLLYNNQSYNVIFDTITYTAKELLPPVSLNPKASDAPEYTPALDEPTITDTAYTYDICTLSTSSSPVAPIISNISCSISTQNVGTTYSFRTYVQKLGFFNKENTDRIKKSALDNIKTNKQINSVIQSFQSQLVKNKQIFDTDISRKNFGTEQFQSGFYGTSPGNVLIGAATPFAYIPQNVNDQFKKLAENEPPPPPEVKFVYGADLGDSTVNSLYNESLSKGMYADLRWRTYVGNYMDKEAMTELAHSYNLKSAMSWDGIFSPVSFYPTKAYSTYSLLKYIRPQCTHCKGSGKINETVFDYNESTQALIEFSCPYCTIKKTQIGSGGTTSTGREVLPPYVITNTNDLNTILEFDRGNTDGGATNSSNNTLTAIINTITLQPVVVPQGQFRNNNAQYDPDKNIVDRCRHCIQVVARGEIPPKAKTAHNLNYNLKTYINKDTGEISQTPGEGFNPDYYPYDIIAQHDRVNTNKSPFVMNQRFFGLRGPIIMHAWGYDTDGYPVPNASDEPQIVDNFGRPARFNLDIKTTTHTTYEKLKNGETFIKKGSDISATGLVYYTKTEGMQIMDDDKNWIFPSGTLSVTKISVENDLQTPANGGQNPHLNYGDIITKQYEHNGSKWVKKEKSNNFALNWAERPDQWPVGPIDLRWDESRRVWTANTGDNSIYKFVYVTLEEDLIRENNLDESYPTRGFLDELEYSKQPLQGGFRRLVYVKDKTGYTAPKGIKLLCRYDRDSGFYEPISKPSVVAQGTIDVGGKAMISMDFAQGNRSLAVPTLLVDYDNPLGFSVSRNRKAMFIFTRGKWTLTSIA